MRSPQEVTDEEILLAFEGKVDPKVYREMIRGKSHEEVIRIQAGLMERVILREKVLELFCPIFS